MSESADSFDRQDARSAPNTGRAEMSGIDLVNAISGKFLLGLSNFASEAGVSAPSGKSQAARLQTGLRVGARSFAKVMEGLNSVTNVLNIAQASLEKIDTIVDKMIGLAEKASKSSISNTTRNRYNADFSALVTDFREVLSKAELDNRDILTTDGLKEIFTLIGLDEEQSDSIAKVFAQFVTTDEDSELASEEVKGHRPVIVPARTVTSSSSSRELQQMSHSTTGGGITTGFVSATNVAYSDKEDFNNQNPNIVESVAYIAPNGNVTAAPAAPSTDVVLKNVSEQSGYSVIVSSQDYLGYNPSNYNQLFLTDETGRVIHQYTNFAADVPAAQWGEADISADGLRAVFAASNGVTDFLFVSNTITTIGDAPTGVTAYYNGAAGTVEFSHIAQNEEGTYFALRYQDTAGGVDSVAMVEWGTGSLDLSFFLGVNNTGMDALGFVGETTIALYQDTVGPVTYTWNAGGSPTTINSFTYPAVLATEPIPAGHFATSQGPREGEGAIAIFGDLNSEGRDRVTLVTGVNGAGDGTITDYAYSPDGADTISRLSLAYNSPANDFDIGIAGTLAALGDSDEELYRYSTIIESAGEGSVKSVEVDSLFTGDEANIRSRPNAVRTLNDLKALKKQIGDNEKAIDFALDTLRKNVTLTREAGLAFLEIADQITSESKAEDVARRLHSEILGNATAALSQAENLEPLVLAALNRLSAGS